MTYQVLSASSGERANACPGSFALEYDYSPPGLFADNGTFIHKFLELYRNDPETARNFLAFTKSDYRRALALAIQVHDVFTELDELIGDQQYEELLEQKFVFDGNEVKLLPKTAKTRDYGSIDNFGGTSDWLAITEDRVYIGDYKTGKFVPPNSEQMRILAGMAYEVWQKPITTVIIHIPAATFPARAKDKWEAARIKHAIVPHTWDNDESRACSTFMRELYSRVTEQRDNAKQGLPLFLNPDREKQCLYCNSKKYCSEYQKINDD